MMRYGLLILIAGLLVVPACASAKKEEPPEVKLPEVQLEFPGYVPEPPPIPALKSVGYSWQLALQ